MSSNSTNHSSTEFFHPVEHKILSTYFRVSAPECACSTEIDDLLSVESDEYVYLESDIDDITGDSAYDNAVARLLLEHVQERLPQWARIKLSTGDIRYSRDVKDPTDKTAVFLPQLLFGINWADTAPGYSRPETYYVTFVPYYDRYVVTRSQDCPELYGYCDVAMGHFSKDTPVLEGARKIIYGDWNKQFGNGQARWEYIISEGLVSSGDSELWADEVWFDPRQILLNLLKENEDEFSTRHGILSALECTAIQEGIYELHDFIGQD